MEIILIRALQLMLSLSILVLLHEAGHCILAKIFGIRVEKFYLFFDPWFHLFESKPKREGGTAYGLGWLPLGGYCKIAGMIDESFDTEQMKKPAQPWEFRSHPAWQRLLVMIGGVAVNFLLALLIYAMVLFAWGEDYVPMKDMSLGMKFNSEAKALGFRDGDIVLGTDKGQFKTFDIDVYRDLADASRADVLRGGKPVAIAMPGDLNLLDMLKHDPRFIYPLTPAVVVDVLPGSPAEKAGMQAGDSITSIGGVPVDSYNELTFRTACLGDLLATMSTHADSLRVRTTSVTVARQGRTDTLSVRLTEEMKFGFTSPAIATLYKPFHQSYGFFESFPAGARYGINVLKGYVGDMRYLASADGAKQVGGFGTIATLFPPVWDWHIFWNMTALLSIILAFMNILPIPALDGGHVLFLLYEMVTRRKPSERFMIWSEYVGFGIVFLLLIVANLNDVLRWIGIF